jgi:hypothetical protein
MAGRYAAIMKLATELDDSAYYIDTFEPVMEFPVSASLHPMSRKKFTFLCTTRRMVSEASRARGGLRARSQ